MKNERVERTKQLWGRVNAVRSDDEKYLELKCKISDSIIPILLEEVEHYSDTYRRTTALMNEIIDMDNRLIASAEENRTKELEKHVNEFDEFNKVLDKFEI